MCVFFSAKRKRFHRAPSNEMVGREIRMCGQQSISYTCIFRIQKYGWSIHSIIGRNRSGIRFALHRNEMQSVDKSLLLYQWKDASNGKLLIFVIYSSVLDKYEGSVAI